MKELKSATIGLSFKKTRDDNELLDWINLHSGKSAFIKDVLRSALLLEKNKGEAIIWGGKIW